MNRFIMKDVLSAAKNLPDAGSVFYKAISDAIQTNQKVEVDMSEVSSLPSIFLNVSVGKIIEESGKEALKSHVVFIHITKGQATRLRDYFNRYN